MEKASVIYLVVGVVLFFLFLAVGADSLLGWGYFLAQFSLHTADVDFSS